MIGSFVKVSALTLTTLGGLSAPVSTSKIDAGEPGQVARAHRDSGEIPSPFAFPSGGRTASTPTFLQANLAHGVVIALPRAWRILGRDELQLIETTAGAVLDLSDTDLGEGQNVVLVAANSTPATTYASVRVTFSAPTKATPAEIKALSALVGASSHTNNDLAGYQRALLPSLKKGLEMQKIPLQEFYGVRIERLSGYPAFVSEYRRSGPKGDVFVQMNEIFTPQGDVKVTLAYRGSESALWIPVLGRIRYSLSLRT